LGSDSFFFLNSIAPGHQGVKTLVSATRDSRNKLRSRGWNAPFDHIVGASEHGRRNVEADSPSLWAVRAGRSVRHAPPPPDVSCQSTHDFLIPVSSCCLSRAVNPNLGGEALKEKRVSHQFSGEPKMRFVSTALVMMAIALMLLALMLLTPTVRANPLIFVANFAGANESAPGGAPMRQAVRLGWRGVHRQR
jgi:hypothetical protein